MIGLIFIDSQTGSDKFLYFLRFQIIMFETLKKMKSDKKQVFADIVYFDLIYHSEKKREKKRENSNRGQKMSAKVCQKFLYCDLTLVAHSCKVDNISPENKWSLYEGNEREDFVQVIYLSIFKRYIFYHQAQNNCTQQYPAKWNFAANALV
jgi:hypothetical protein